jgi:hypothetical protein
VCVDAALRGELWVLPPRSLTDWLLGADGPNVVGNLTQLQDAPAKQRVPRV